MPIKIPSGLPARDILDSERIFALEKPEAERQRVRPLKLVILNLMPKKIETETQLLRLISKSPLQVEIDFMKTSTHEATHVSADHLVKFYENLDAFKDNYYDGFVVTGAPVEHMPFEDVDYWDEFKTILDWASTHVFSTIYLCWGAMGALYYRYGIHKVDYPEKIFGVFPQYLQDEYCFLTNGFDEIDLQPHSRLAGVNENEVRANHDLQILTWGPQSGPGLIDPKLEPLFAWRAHANLLWRNWLNWVYQTTPYDLTEVPQLRAEKKLGTDRSIRHEPGGPRQDDFKPFVHDGYGVIQG